jgi:hypothetical protein
LRVFVTPWCRYWTSHLASSKPDSPARDLAWTIQRFFCAVEDHNEAVRRCLDSIVAMLRRVGRVADDAKKALIDYNPHLMAAVTELNHAQASFRGRVLLLPRALRLRAPLEYIQVPSHVTLLRILRLMKFRDVSRGAQTKNKRTLWALRRVMPADHIIRRLHQYAPIPEPQPVNVSSLLLVLARSLLAVFKCS